MKVLALEEWTRSERTISLRGSVEKRDERRSKMALKKVLERQDILRVVERLLEVSIERNEPFAEPIVMAEGTAMIAHDLRKQSYDVDLFVKDFSIDAVASVELEFKEIFGESFRIDVTSVENIWGFIMLRDIRNAEPDTEIQVKGRSFTLRKLGMEDLFFLKLDSGREKDRADLSVLARNTTLDRLTDRFNVIWKWHGSPDAVLGLADNFVSFMRGIGNAPADVLERLDLPDSMLRNLSETWKEEGDE